MALDFLMELAGVGKTSVSLEHVISLMAPFKHVLALSGVSFLLGGVFSETQTTPKKQILRVLMLGWEFPPAITGGLGIACHDLCAALAKHVRLTVVIPRSEKNQQPENMRLLGLNSLKSTELTELSITSGYDGLQAEVHYVPAQLNPYARYEESASFNSSQTGSAVAADSLDIGELYGPRMLEKVISYAQRVTSLAKNMRFDIVHAHDWMTLLAGMEIKHRTGKPLVAHIHALEYDRVGADSQSPIYQIEKAGLEMADLVLPVSQYTAGVIRNHYGIDSKKIIAVHNGIRKARTFRTPKPFEEKIVLFVGRLTRQKAPDRFLEIAAKVSEQYPDTRFVVAGTGDSFESLVWQSAYKYLGHRFHYTGFLSHERMSELLSMADVYCMPSVSEPFGLSALEAAQFGVPCVISKQSGVSEVLHGAMTFDCWDTDKAARHIISLLQDEELRKNIVADAYRDLQDIHWEGAAEKVLAAYKKLPLFRNTKVVLN